MMFYFLFMLKHGRRKPLFPNPFGIILEKKCVRISIFFHAIAQQDVGQWRGVRLLELFCVFSL
jgi:hypothetical protein